MPEQERSFDVSRKSTGTYRMDVFSSLEMCWVTCLAGAGTKMRGDGHLQLPVSLITWRLHAATNRRKFSACACQRCPYAPHRLPDCLSAVYPAQFSLLPSRRSFPFIVSSPIPATSKEAALASRSLGGNRKEKTLTRSAFPKGAIIIRKHTSGCSRQPAASSHQLLVRAHDSIQYQTVCLDLLPSPIPSDGSLTIRFSLPVV